ncbi:sodium:solute symporter [Alloalcanivorax mobilis]|uniref:sodium:solute symporter n=1 Tax=Alloalcanivorax mobilis TaxID=2019569 RepID=UPI000B5B1690|nr:sodium:solute symporter [Alloalcanivorax mobilis]ASK33145.1 sodium:solute symporter [Alcanivorax sp. N3-2A]ASK36963.1 sodium:solute symporter [Alcanivorax sp. N3-2A]|tara:strand:+ start:38840 stop:40375 length:1536 start_codon:yes stop_codon:yes gene_type:complete
MTLSVLDWAVLLAYLLAVLLIGVYFARRNTSTEEYFVGGRRFKGWVIGLSLVGTSISSITFLAYPADAFKTAWLRYLPNLALPVALVLAAFVFLPFFRRGNMTSAYEFLELRFGPSVRVYGALAFIIAQLVRLAMILWLLSLLVQQLLPVSPTVAIVAAGLFVGVYTVIGGIDAVIWTDVLQTVVLLMGGILCVWVVVDALPGGLTQVFQEAGAAGKFALAEWQDGQPRPVNWGFSLSEKTATMMLLIGLTNWLTEYSSNQNTVQRYCASRSTREARRGLWVYLFTALPTWAFYMLLGTALWVFFQHHQDQMAQAVLAGEARAETIMPWFITRYLPSGIAGLVVAAALAAAMSSLDSSINSVSTVSVVDLYRRHLRPGASDQHYLRVAKSIASGVTVAMILGALWLNGASTSTLQDTSTILVSLLGGGMLGLYLLGFFSHQGNARAAWCGILATLVFTGWTVLGSNGLLPTALSAPFDLYYTGLIGNLIMLLVGYGAARLWQSARRTAPAS